MCAFKKNEMKKLLSFIILLSPFLIFGQIESITNSGSTFELKHYFEVSKSDEKGVFNLLHKTDTLESKELTIDEKIDKSFRPVADGVGSVIFYPLSIGEVSESGTIHISDSTMDANKDGVLLSLSAMKIGDLQKAPESLQLISDNGVIEKIDGQYFQKELSRFKNL